MALKSITTVTSIPTDGPDHANMSGKVLRIESYPDVEVLARASAGAGTVVLLRWRPEVSKWAPWGATATTGGVDIDSSKRGGWTHGRWAGGKARAGEYAVLAEGGPGIAECWIGGLDL